MAGAGTPQVGKDYLPRYADENQGKKLLALTRGRWEGVTEITMLKDICTPAYNNTAQTFGVKARKTA